MGAVAKSGEVPEWWSERNNKQAAKLLRLFDQSATKPMQHMGVPSFPHVGGDHPIPQGMFVGLLFAPFVWPVDSETELAGEAEALGREEQFHEQQGNEVHRLSQQVFNNSWTAGEGAEAAQEAYRATAAARFEQADVAGFAKKLVARVSGDVERTKRWMLRENNTAHQEAEAFLRTGSGQSIAQIAVILSQHRTMIQTYSADLHANVANDTLLFTNQFPLSPNGGKEPKIKQTGNGLTSDQSPDEPAPGAPPPRPAAGVAGDHSPGGERSPRTPGGRMVPHSPDNELGPLPKSTPSPLASLGGGGLPGLPSMPGGGGGVPGFPMSMLQGLGKFPGAAGLPSTGGLSSSVSPPPALSSLGADFGRGLAAGATAAGAMPTAPPPSAPLAPLMASPVESTVAAAAPAAAPVAAPMSSAAPAAGVSGMTAGGLAPYGSVLSPAMSSSAPVGVGAPVGLSVPAEGAVSSAGGGSSAGLMPVGGRRGVTPVSRDRAESDLGLARMAVADLAGAASVTDPGLDWAVAVGRGRSGATCFWVATNDGATYIPPGVFVGKTWPIAAVFDEDFDARWFGWVNPADKAVRAARALGVAVSAVATSWALPSEYLTDDMAVPEIANGVKPSSVENLASELSRSRSHRLQTVDAALYQAVVDAKDSVVREYSRELLRRLVFGGDADDLSAVAQSVAAALVAGRWPAREEWAALGAEYDTAVILAGAQRPGLDGLENPDQMVSYARLFVNCRRLEALLCWERYGGDLANVVYAAWVCGVRLSFSNIASSYVLT